jgi:hypothetical protein
VKWKRSPPIKLRYTGRVIDLTKAFDSQNIMYTEPIEFVKQYMDTTVGPRHFERRSSGSRCRSSTAC